MNKSMNHISSQARCHLLSLDAVQYVSTEVVVHAITRQHLSLFYHLSLITGRKGGGEGLASYPGPCVECRRAWWHLAGFTVCAESAYYVNHYIPYWMHSNSHGG